VTNESCATCKYKKVVNEFNDALYFEVSIQWHKNKILGHVNNEPQPAWEKYKYKAIYCMRYPEKVSVADSHWCGEYDE
jgi:hypothetical protein